VPDRVLVSIVLVRDAPGYAPAQTAPREEGMLISSGIMRQCCVRIHKGPHGARSRTAEGLGYWDGAERQSEGPEPCSVVRAPTL
jgi:hypothetical protein